MYKYACFILFGFVSSIAVAADPSQLDILGLIPGVSDIDQLRNTSNAKEGFSEQHSGGDLWIGGHYTACEEAKFINGKLAELTCITGIKGLAASSNSVVHNDLLKGFTKKFGKASNVGNMDFQTASGGWYQSNVAIWKDKRGNQLTIYSAMGSADTGMILLESAAFRQKAAAEAAVIESKRKF